MGVEMKHELLDLYKLANETKDKDAIRAFQQARDRIGPQIAVDLILENNRLRAELAAERKARISEVEDADNMSDTCVQLLERVGETEAQVEVMRKYVEKMVELYEELPGCAIRFDGSEDEGQRILANLPARAEKIKAVLGAADAFVEKHNQLKHSDVLALCKAVREWRSR